MNNKPPFEPLDPKNIIHAEALLSVAIKNPVTSSFAGAVNMDVWALTALIEALRDNERLRQKFVTLTHAPVLLDLAKDHDGNCIICGNNYDKLRDFANDALKPIAAHPDKL